MINAIQITDKCLKCGKKTFHFSGLCRSCRTVACVVCGKPIAINNKTIGNRCHKCSYTLSVRQKYDSIGLSTKAVFSE